jgi:hypothetical protein
MGSQQRREGAAIEEKIDKKTKVSKVRRLCLFELEGSFGSECSVHSIGAIQSKKATSPSASSSSSSSSSLSSSSSSSSSHNKQKEDLSSYSCARCRWRGRSLEEQRAHFQTEWHSYNARGGVRLSERAFVGTTEDQRRALEAERAARIEARGEQRAEARRLMNAGLPVVYFSHAPTRTVFPVFKSVLRGDGEDEDEDGEDEAGEGAPFDLEAQRYLSALQGLVGKRPVWCVFLVAAGHIALGVFEGAALVASRAFHRYVIRAKRGTRQATHDKGGRAPISAGSSLRRANEVALKDDCRGLLELWKPMINAAEAIFIAAPGVVNRSTLFYEGGPVKTKDPRIRGVPFPTARPTVDEVKAVHARLCMVTPEDASAVPALAPIVRDSAAARASKKDKREPAEGGGGEQPSAVPRAKGTAHLKARPDKDKEKERGAARSRGKALARADPPDTPLVRAVRVGDASAVAALLAQDPELANLPSDRLWTMTPLTIAAQLGAEETVAALVAAGADKDARVDGLWTALCFASSKGHAETVTRLLDLGADPTLRTEAGKTAYTLAPTGNPATRDSFRLWAGMHPDAWDWQRAAVMDPLTAEEAEALAVHRAEQRAREAAKKKAKESVKKEEKRIDKVEADREKLSDRERRALAAEERLRAQSAPHEARKICAFCKAELAPSQVPFTRLEFSYCSTRCVKAHIKLGLGGGGGGS